MKAAEKPFIVFRTKPLGLRRRSISGAEVLRTNPANGKVIVPQLASQHKTTTYTIFHPQVTLKPYTTVEDMGLEDEAQTEKFVLDNVLPNVAQAEMFDRVAMPLALQLLRGVPACLIGYGTSKSGKTYSMMGNEDSLKGKDSMFTTRAKKPEKVAEIGMLPRIMEFYTQWLHYTGCNADIYLSSVELFGDSVKDLHHARKLEDFGSSNISIDHIDHAGILQCRFRGNVLKKKVQSCAQFQALMRAAAKQASGVGHVCHLLHVKRSLRMEHMKEGGAKGQKHAFEDGKIASLGKDDIKFGCLDSFMIFAETKPRNGNIFAKIDSSSPAKREASAKALEDLDSLRATAAGMKDDGEVCKLRELLLPALQGKYQLTLLATAVREDTCSYWDTLDTLQFADTVQKKVRIYIEPQLNEQQLARIEDSLVSFQLVRATKIAEQQTKYVQHQADKERRRELAQFGKEEAIGEHLRAVRKEQWERYGKELVKRMCPFWTESLLVKANDIEIARMSKCIASNGRQLIKIDMIEAKSLAKRLKPAGEEAFTIECLSDQYRKFGAEDQHLDFRKIVLGCLFTRQKTDALLNILRILSDPTLHEEAHWLAIKSGRRKEVSKLADVEWAEYMREKVIGQARKMEELAELEAEQKKELEAQEAEEKFKAEERERKQKARVERLDAISIAQERKRSSGAMLAGASMLDNAFGNETSLGKLMDQAKAPDVDEGGRRMWMANWEGGGYEEFIEQCESIGIVPRFHCMEMMATDQECVDLTGYGAGDELALAMTEVLKSCHHVKEIHLADNNLLVEGVLAFVNALPKSVTLVDFSRNQLGSTGASAVITSLVTNGNRSLQSLSMEKNGLDDRFSVHALLGHCTLTELNLGGNQLGDHVATIFGELLATDPPLTSLDLSWNRIQDVGGVHLAMALRTNEHLDNLNMSTNSLQDEAGMALGLCLLAGNHSIRILNVGGNNLGDPSMLVFSKALLKNQVFEYLDISEITLSPMVIKEFGKSVEQSGSTVKGLLEAEERAKGMVRAKIKSGIPTKPKKKGTKKKAPSKPTFGLPDLEDISSLAGKNFRYDLSDTWQRCVAELMRYTALDADATWTKIKLGKKLFPPPRGKFGEGDFILPKRGILSFIFTADLQWTSPPVPSSSLRFDLRQREHRFVSRALLDRPHLTSLVDWNEYTGDDDEGNDSRVLQAGDRRGSQLDQDFALLRQLDQATAFVGEGEGDDNGDDEEIDDANSEDGEEKSREDEEEEEEEFFTEDALKFMSPSGKVMHSHWISTCKVGELVLIFEANKPEVQRHKYTLELSDARERAVGSQLIQAIYDVVTDQAESDEGKGAKGKKKLEALVAGTIWRKVVMNGHPVDMLSAKERFYREGVGWKFPPHATLVLSFDSKTPRHMVTSKYKFHLAKAGDRAVLDDVVKRTAGIYEEHLWSATVDGVDLLNYTSHTSAGTTDEAKEGDDLATKLKALATSEPPEAKRMMPNILIMSQVVCRPLTRSQTLRVKRFKLDLENPTDSCLAHRLRNAAVNSRGDTMWMQTKLHDKYMRLATLENKFWALPTIGVIQFTMLADKDNLEALQKEEIVLVEKAPPQVFASSSEQGEAFLNKSNFYAKLEVYMAETDKRVLDVFNAHDKEHHKALLAEDFKSFVTDLGIEATDEDIANVIYALDVDHNGEVSFKELNEAVHENHKKEMHDASAHGKKFESAAHKHTAKVLAKQKAAEEKKRSALHSNLASSFVWLELETFMSSSHERVQDLWKSMVKGHVEGFDHEGLKSLIRHAEIQVESEEQLDQEVRP
jgi:Ca2+-binding EF-hand superfamily protein/Ran GTPase-activating protein (RanGAP) involved in mRNA processing and transport